MEELKSKERAVGIKECRKLVRQNEAQVAYIAKDASPHIVDPFRALCDERGVPVRDAESMEALGKACGITVGAAVAIIKRK